MHITKTLVCSLAVLTCTSGAWAVLTADDFKTIRLIRNPYDREGLSLPSGNRKDANAYRTGGISNAGDLFGDAVWPADPEHEEHTEQPVRWLRDTGYEPEIVNGGMEHIARPCCGGEKGATVTPGESFWGLESGWHRETPFNKHRGVTPDGFAVGGYAVNNFFGYHYDIRNDVLTNLGPGWHSGANNSGLVTSVWSSCCGAHGSGYYSKVVSIHAPNDADPKHEVAAWKPTFGFGDPFPLAINNQNIIVGNMGSIFLADRQAMKMLPTGENTWSDPIPLDAIESEGGTILASSTVLDISNNVDRPFGVGVSGSSHAVVWDINAGTIVADFGNLTTAWQISGDGTKVAGLRSVFAIPPRKIPTVWSTDDGWASFTELELEEALAFELGLEGADIWLELTDIDGVNDSGQVVGIGNIMGTDGTAQQTVFLLDTLDLDLAQVLKGDVDDDGSVNNLDITPFIAALSAADEAAFLTQFPNGNYAAADVDMSGSANNLDITPFIGLLTAASATAVPEPSSLACVVLALMMGRRRAARR